VSGCADPARTIYDVAVNTDEYRRVLDRGNIGAAGQRQRRRAGSIMLALALLLVVLLAMTGASRWWYLALFPFLWVSALGFVQAQERTCVALAARGVCELDDGRRSALHPDAAGVLRKRGRTIMWRSAAVAGTATVLALLLA
jgi:hypothetical protein